MLPHGAAPDAMGVPGRPLKLSITSAAVLSFGVIAIGCPTLALAAVTSGDGRTLVTRSLPIPSGPPGEALLPAPPAAPKSNGDSAEATFPLSTAYTAKRAFPIMAEPEPVQPRGLVPYIFFFSIRVPAVLCLPASQAGRGGGRACPYPKVRDSLTEESRKKGNQGGNGCVSHSNGYL